MKASYNEKEVWDAVAYAMPSIGIAHEKGVNFNLASLVDDALLKLLLDVRNGVYLETGVAGMSIQCLVSAYEDLHSKAGSFNFKD